MASRFTQVHGGTPTYLGLSKSTRLRVSSSRHPQLDYAPRRPKNIVALSRGLSAHLLFPRLYHMVEAHVSGVWELDRSDGVTSHVGPRPFIALVALLKLLAAARGPKSLVHIVSSAELLA